jgi:hypothetical protein
MARSPQKPDFEYRVLSIQRSAVRIHAGGVGYQGALVTIWGEMDKAVLREKRFELSVDLEGANRQEGGVALGVNVNTWRVAVTLSQAAFASLLTVTMAGRLSHAGLLVERIVRGKANVRSVTFSTEPIDPGL